MIKKKTMFFHRLPSWLKYAMRTYTVPIEIHVCCFSLYDFTPCLTKNQHQKKQRQSLQKQKANKKMRGRKEYKKKKKKISPYLRSALGEFLSIVFFFVFAVSTLHTRSFHKSEFPVSKTRISI